MTQPIFNLIAISAAFLTSNALWGYEATYAVGYGTFTIMAAMVALTFLWLWARRATPLAIGMFFGWAGAALVVGWWWVYALLGQPDWMLGNPTLFLFVAVYFVGAILHFKVIAHSFGLKGSIYYVPLVVSLAGSVLMRVIL